MSQAMERGLRLIAGFAPLALLLLPHRPALAEERAVRIACGELSADDTAKVEARVQSSLLVIGAANVEVRVECGTTLAHVTARAGERSETKEVVLPQASLADALVAASEAALGALFEGPADATASFPSEPSKASPPNEPAKATAPAAASSPSTDAGAPSNASKPGRAASHRAFRVGGGALGESWHGVLAGGGRLVAEKGFGAPVVGVTLGILTPLERHDGFGATEWHAAAFGGYQAHELGGVRGTLSVGVSFLTVSPDPDLIALSDTSATHAFGEIALSRPISLGKLVLVPALDLRVFPSARTVTVDGVESVRLSGFNAGLFLGILYEL
jgi:hypothetical protein